MKRIPNLMILALAMLALFVTVAALPGCGNVQLRGEAMTAAEISTGDAYTAYVKAADDANCPGWTTAYLCENVKQWREKVRSAKRSATWGPTLPDEKSATTGPPEEAEYD